MSLRLHTQSRCLLRQRLLVRSPREEQEARREQYRSDKKIRSRMYSMGLCAGGFGWHREGHGFRCNGGVCWLSEEEVAQVMAEEGY